MNEFTSTLGLSIVASLLALLCLCALLRRRKLSLGLPIAYLALLLVNHVPGAATHLLVDDERARLMLSATEYTTTGMLFTAIGACCFLVGVWVAQLARLPWPPRFREMPPLFPRFCLYCGWITTFMLLPIASIPSIGAAVDKGGAIWILGTLIGLQRAVSAGRLLATALWLAALMVYPIMILLLSGLLSYGTAAVLISLSVLAIGGRSLVRVAISIVVLVTLGLNLFVNYFVARNDIRNVTWSDAGFVARIAGTLNAFSDIKPISLSDPKHVFALDRRLNQNYFIGISAARLEANFVDYRYGWSLAEAGMSLIPRAIWPDKPVYGGSPAIVREMTGLQLNENTSWGVGNVMEFYINFGIPGLVLGFLALGWLLGALDRGGALALAQGDVTKAIVCFLPAVSLIQPIGSLVELASGAAAGWVAALAWRWVWISVGAGFAQRAGMRG